MKEPHFFYHLKARYELLCTFCTFSRGACVVLPVTQFVRDKALLSARVPLSHDTH